MSKWEEWVYDEPIKTTVKEKQPQKLTEKPIKKKAETPNNPKVKKRGKVVAGQPNIVIFQIVVKSIY